MVTNVPMKPRQGYDVSDHMTTHVPPSNQMADISNDNFSGSAYGAKVGADSAVGVLNPSGSSYMDYKKSYGNSLPSPSNDNTKLRLVK